MLESPDQSAKPRPRGRARSYVLASLAAAAGLALFACSSGNGPTSGPDAGEPDATGAHDAQSDGTSQPDMGGSSDATSGPDGSDAQQTTDGSGADSATVPDAGDGGQAGDASDGAACPGTVCNGKCTDTQTDDDNCGSCGKACAGSQVCSGGTCATTCGTQTTCTIDGGAPYCADTGSDNHNCGTCGNVCPSGTVCASGTCGVTCGSLTLCTPDGGAPYCTDTNDNNENCGKCGNVCGSGTVCASGTCGLTCGALTLCQPDGGSPYCADTNSDNQNCGTCGTVCPGGDACQAGQCQASCPTGDTVCSGTCTNVNYDPSNCGKCGTVCSFANASAACASGTCFLAACNAPFADCDHTQSDGCEVNTGTDRNNCGACGHSCGLGETCSAGSCTLNLTSNLLGWWQMNDAAGSLTAADSSGNNLSGSVQGAVAFKPGAGKQGGGAASFTGGYIDVTFPNDARGDGTGLFMPQGNITYAMWIQTATAGTPMQGLQVVWGVTWGGGWDRVIGNGNDSGPAWYNAWSEQNFQSATAVNDTNWHHVVYVLDETNGFIAYVDGAQDVADATATSNCGVGCSGFNWASNYRIGTGMDGRFNANAFSGLICDVRIYSIPLTASGVATLYNATK